MKILMCNPSYFDILYEINPWMNVSKKTDVVKATVQWRKLFQTIESLGVTMELIEPVTGLPDMVFTANGALIKGNKALVAQFKHSERQAEEHYFKHWLIKNNYEIVDPTSSTRDSSFEGEGDALFAGDKLFAGCGIRSDRDYYEKNIPLLSPDINVIYCEMIDPYFYHLDTCFCPLNDELGFWWPKAFSEESRAQMSQSLELIAVPEQEAKKFACNAVVVDKDVIIPAGCPEITKTLQDAGYTVYACEMSEFIKSGGACKCLTLYL